jgi:hypothetical protein
MPRLFALPAVALIMLDAGEPERAVELCASTGSHSFGAGSRWFDDVVGQRIAAAAVALSAEMLTAAQERARARDLEPMLKELLAELAD